MSHKTPEDMIADGQEFATFEDLDGLDSAVLVQIMKQCQEPATDESVDFCVPCRAYQMLAERNHQSEIVNPDDFEGDRDTPKLDALLAEGTDASSVADQFADKVSELNVLVAQLLQGPPIPPPNVTMDELAALVVGAERWLKIIDAQGVELSPQQEQIKTHIAAVIGKVRHG